MDLVSVVLFLVMYYIRPQEWFSLLNTIHFVQLVMIMALVSLFGRENKVELRDLVKTPHDWMILFFFLWMVLTNSSPITTFQNNYPLAMFYFVIVQTMTSVKRLKVFVAWWTFLIVAIAALSIASEYGFDPLGSNDVTVGHMKGRLVLNLSIFNNPNALGHSVLPCIPMLYYFCIWKRPLIIKEVGALLMILPLWCVFLTASKGAFLTGGVVLVATYAFGRPKGVQLLILAIAAACGGTLMHMLPRMNELEKAKADQAIQGRVAAFTHGLKVIQENIRGCGRDHWMESFHRAHHYYKACHSGYVQVGAELGYPGLFLYFGILYCCLRTLLTMKPGDIEVERIRRTLFVLVLSFMVSSWMVDFGFRATLFMFAAAVAALHRLSVGTTAPAVETVDQERASYLPAWRARLLPQPALSAALATGGGPRAAVFSLEKKAVQLPWQPTAPAEAESNGEPVPEPAIRWMKLGFVDFALILAMTILAVKFWSMMVKRM